MRLPRQNPPTIAGKPLPFTIGGGGAALAWVAVGAGGAAAGTMDALAGGAAAGGATADVLAAGCCIQAGGEI